MVINEKNFTGYQQVIIETLIFAARSAERMVR